MDVVFDHERLRVYQRALDFYSWVFLTLPQLPRGHAPVLDQLRRAGSSVALNIAEGAGKYELADKRRHYLIARGSAMECAAVLDVLARGDLIEPQLRVEGRVMLRDVVAMLVKLAMAVELP
jgi:four helix bundle protein